MPTLCQYAFNSFFMNLNIVSYKWKEKNVNKKNKSQGFEKRAKAWFGLPTLYVTVHHLVDEWGTTPCDRARGDGGKYCDISHLIY